MKRLTLVLMALLLTACSNQARLDYYAAVQAAAEAQARESEARYTALSSMAHGGGEASAAAVMAIALSQKPVIQPAYIEDDALKWAQILAGPVASIAALAVQADLSRDLNKRNSQVAIARIEQEAATDQVLFNALTQPSAVAPPSLGIDELGVVVDGLVALGLNGTDSTLIAAQGGMDGMQAISTSGLNAVSQTATQGLNATVTVSGQGMDALTSITHKGYETFLDIVMKNNITLESFFDQIGQCGCIPSTVGVAGGGNGGPSFSPRPPQ